MVMQSVNIGHELTKLALRLFNFSRTTGYPAESMLQSTNVSIICFTGTIGFIGLVAPYVTRMLIGGDHRFLLPASGLIGAFLLLGADRYCVRDDCFACCASGGNNNRISWRSILSLPVHQKKKRIW